MSGRSGRSGRSGHGARCVGGGKTKQKGLIYIIHNGEMDEYREIYLVRATAAQEGRIKSTLRFAPRTQWGRPHLLARIEVHDGCPVIKWLQDNKWRIAEDMCLPNYLRTVMLADLKDELQ